MDAYNQNEAKRQEAIAQGQLPPPEMMKPNETLELWFSNILIDRWIENYFSVYDINKNGVLEREEAKRCIREYLASFGKLDFE